MYSRRSVLTEANNQNQTQPQDQQQQPQAQQQQHPIAAPVQQQHHHQQQQPFVQSLFNHMPIPSAPHHHQTNIPSSSLNILTPSNQPSNIPGLIPLVSLNPQLYQQSQLDGGRNTLPINLSEDDLRILSTTTRDALEQRLRILTNVDEQISDSIIKLTRVLSAMPIETTSINQQHSTQTATNDTNINLSSQKRTGNANEAVSHNDAAKPSNISIDLEDSGNRVTEIQTVDGAVEEEEEHQQHQQDISDRRREKMPNYAASSSIEQE